MNTQKIFVLILSLFLGFTLSVNAQNVPYKHFKILKGDTLSFQLSGNGFAPDDIVQPTHGEIPVGSSVAGTGSTLWNMQYWPTDSTFIGIDPAVIEYRGNPGSSAFDWPIKIIKIDFEIVNSMLTAKNDFYTVTKNSTGDTLDILINDSTDAGALSLDRILNTKNGTVSITNDNKIIFIPDNNFEGIAYFNYQISDEKGSVELGHVKIKIAEEFIAPDTLSYYVTNSNVLPIVLDNDGFSIDPNNSPSIGSLDFTNNPEIIYTPSVDSVGIDQFKLINDSDTIIVFVHVVESNEKNNVIVDDKIYTAKNTSISFNVKDNDYKKNYWNVTYSNPSNGSLTYEGQAKFTYTPNNNFYGFDQFSYTVQLSLNLFQTATVEILVDDFKPDNSKPYEINTSQNSEVVLNYKIPLEDYSFNLVSAPLDGILNIYPDIDTVHVNCSDIAGNNLIVYTPNTDFVGNDRFEIEYCPPNENCQLIKVEVNVLEELSDTICPCASYNCVWPGDANNNGIVDMKDLLPLAYYIGNTGSERTSNTSNWLGLKTNDWDKTQSDNGFNLKHIDANGDGILNEDDSLAILSNYHNQHNLYNNVAKNKPQFPVNLIFSQDTFEVGDTVHIFISVGDEDYPAKDINGIFYTLQFDPKKVDSSSFHHEFLLDSWLANATTPLQMDKQYQDGQLDAVFSRINPNSVSGIGIIAKCDYIVEDDLDGIINPTYSQMIPAKISVSNVSGMNGDGDIIEMSGAEKTIFIKYRGTKVENNKTTKLSLFPNPTYNEFKLSSNKKISKYRIYNSLGLLQMDKNIDNSSFVTVDIRALSNGIYYIEVITIDNEKTIKKIEVLKK